MPRQTKTIEELNNDLNNLKCRYELEALDIDRLLINYHRYDTAKKYLSRNKDKPSNDPQIIEKRRIVSKNHEAYKKYRSIQNIENKITLLRRMNMNSEIFTNMNQCMNCRRKNHNSLQSIYSLALNSVQRATIRSGNLWFKNIASNAREGIDNYILCKECKEYLVSKNNDLKNIWPSFIWHLLS